jgi:hypothetical protein
VVQVDLPEQMEPLQPPGGLDQTVLGVAVVDPLPLEATPERLAAQAEQAQNIQLLRLLAPQVLAAAAAAAAHHSLGLLPKV